MKCLNIMNKDVPKMLHGFQGTHVAERTRTAI